jgi:hypothetical protein
MEMDDRSLAMTKAHVAWWAKNEHKILQEYWKVTSKKIAFCNMIGFTLSNCIYFLKSNNIEMLTNFNMAKDLSSIR